jgi:hypothetical protein
MTLDHSSLGLVDPNVNLSPPQFSFDPDTTGPAPPIDVDFHLGGNAPTAGAAGEPPPAVADHRQHPAFRTEWLQKVLNLTTVRSHQYAVWVTVGYFEVTQVGNPQLANDPANYQGAIDRLGPELANQPRSRAFLILDRTRARGFDPRDPEDYRRLIIHRRRIQ